ncbi:hypothetical protein SNR37_000573 [Agarivorans aestuarii]|uniref:Diguanylate cyclase n=1 Tax=Agarivorans aestuarii TaxID=1563703 RepID=A0ABU7G7F5_9ALTE|nr:hypothetical protein [Agarivorans aestuarii]MEE1675248.1 hypothetical protein [Agarivorans aestuarii]
MAEKDLIEKLQGFPLAWHWSRNSSQVHCDKQLIDALAYPNEAQLSLKQLVNRLEAEQVSYLQRAIFDTQHQEQTLELNLIFNIKQKRYVGQVLIWRELVNQVNGSIEFILPLLDKSEEQQLIQEHLASEYTPAIICNQNDSIIWLNQAASKALQQPSYYLLASRVTLADNNATNTTSKIKRQIKSLAGQLVPLEAKSTSIHTNAPKQRFTLYKLVSETEPVSAQRVWNSEAKFAQQLALAQKSLAKQETLIVFALKLENQDEAAAQRLRQLLLSNLKKLNQAISIAWLGRGAISGFLSAPKKLQAIQQRLEQAISQLLTPNEQGSMGAIQSQMGVSVMGIDASNSQQAINHAQKAMLNAEPKPLDQLAQQASFFDSRLNQARDKLIQSAQPNNSKPSDRGELYIDLSD